MTTRRRLVSFTVLAALLSAAPPLSAQTASALAAGLSFSRVVPADSRAGTFVAPGLLLRLRVRDGLGPGLGLNWFTSEVRGPIGGRDVPIGKLNVKPLMLGASYGRYLRPRLFGDASLEAGYAFNNIRGTGDARRAFRELGVREVAFHASDSFVWRANASLWFELGPRYALLTSVAFLATRPTVTTTTSAGTRSDRFNLASAVMTVGIVYGIF